VKCFTIPRSWKQEGVEAFINDALSDPENLMDDYRDEIMQDLIPQKSATSMKSKEKAAIDTSTMLGKIKRNFMDMDTLRKNSDNGNELENSSKKKMKFSEAELNEVNLFELYKNKNADELKDYMRYA
jgi:hypothetical protein